jgi:hypothetical protein
MPHAQFPHRDLEAFQRWAMVVDDQLREAVDAVMALEDPDTEPLRDDSDLLHSERSSADLASDTIEEINAFKESPDRPVWFTPAFQMVLVVSTWATFLMDYVEEVAEQGSIQADATRLRLIEEKIHPAIELFGRFLEAVTAAGHLSNA